MVQSLQQYTFLYQVTPFQSLQVIVEISVTDQFHLVSCPSFPNTNTTTPTILLLLDEYCEPENLTITLQAMDMFIKMQRSGEDFPEKVILIFGDGYDDIYVQNYWWLMKELG